MVKPINAAIRSTRRLFRDALAACLDLQPDFAVVGHVADLADLPGLCLLRGPDLLIVDTGTDVTAELAPLQRLHETFPHIRIVTLYDDLSPAHLALSQRLGVDTLVPSSHGLEALLVILRQHAPQRPLPDCPDAYQDRLTPEEQEIIALIGTGYPVTRIAAMLGSSRYDVENSKRRIYSKLAVASQSQVVARAAALGIVNPTGPSTPDSRRGGPVGPDGHLPQLTAREADILRSIAMGHTVRQTARFLAIAEKTVENTQARLFLKLGAHSRASALATAHGLGLLDLVFEDPPEAPPTDDEGTA